MTTGSDNQEARDFLKETLRPNTTALGVALANTSADGYSSAALALAAQGDLNPLSVATVGDTGQSANDYWDSWKPGNVAASDLLHDHGFQNLLTGADVRIKGIADTTLDRMGTLLAEGAARGDSVDTIANALYDLVGDTNRAYIIADTELARATSQASLATFEANGIETWDWVLSDGACDECEGEADANPHELSDEPPPAHPGCRCAAAPRGGVGVAVEAEE